MWKILAISVIVFSSFVNGELKVPCYFIFGDSLSDVGNNNGFRTMAKANYPPYGVDFPGGKATGRFSNGRTIEDFITQFLGFEKFIQPYRTQMDKKITRGVNFASGAAGILTQTGSNLGDRVWMDRQLLDFRATILKLQFMVQRPVSNYLNKCLFTVNIGSNDYINNYFMPQYYPTKKLFTPEQYADLLIAQYGAQLQTLYNFGARKVAIFGLGLIGCAPAVIAMNNATQCVDEINQAAKLFNTKLVSLVDDFNAKLRGANYTVINISALQAASPPPPGSITNSTCCKLRSDYQCEPFTPPCLDRNMYFSMDGFHPTEVVNELVATISFKTPFPSIVHPVDIQQLISS